MKRYFDLIVAEDPEYKEIPEFMPDGEYKKIKAITYDGAKIGDKKTKVFAYLGYPDNISEKVPAMVLVHGGGGVAYLKWVKMWNDLGYAAIAMSTTGDFPKEVNAAADEVDQSRSYWNYGMFGVFEEEGYVKAPENDAMKNYEKPYDEQWMYHAVSSVILANSILRKDSNIDSDKIGITGISWGGVITSLAIGFDSRFAFAIPIYGSGYLTEDKGTLGEYFRSGTNPDMWLAEKYFKDVKIPVLWLCWNKDTPFSLNSNSKSYLDTIVNNPDTRISAINKMEHSHERGWVRQESYMYADSVCKNKPKLPTFTSDGNFDIINPDNVKITSVKLYYITEPLSYTKNEKNEYSVDQDWMVEEYEGSVPSSAKAYYLELISEIEGTEYVSTSSFVTLY